MAAQDDYTLLAACRNYEYAKEYVLREEGKKRKHGAFTYFLAEELMKIPPGTTPTCREVFERVKYHVSRKYRTQMPQCEGDRERLLFGGVTAVRDPLMTVENIKRKDNSIWIDAGLVHGITTGTILNVYPSETRTLEETTPVLGTITVVNAESVKSKCMANNGLKVELFSRASVHASSTTLAKRTVAIDIQDDDDLVFRMEDQLQGADLKPYVDVFIGENEAADFTIGLSDDEELTIRDTSGKLVVRPSPMNETDLVAEDIAALCRYHNVLDLRNVSRTSALNGKISVALHEIVTDAPGEETTQKARTVRDVRPIATTADGVPIVRIGTPIAIEVKNESEKPLFCEAISFGYDFAIVPLTGLITSAGTHKRVEPASSLWFGRDESDRRIIFSPPSDPVEKEQFTEAREFLKIIATEDEADYEILRQKGLRLPVSQHRSASGSALGQIFSQAMSGSRALGVEENVVDESDWTTTEMEYLVARAADETAHEVAAGSRVALPEYDVEVETPEGLTCTVRVLSEVENVRSVDDSFRERPSGPVWEENILEPIALASRRSTAPAGAVIEIEADTDELSKVSPDQPLRLHLPNEDEASTVAIAWDGEFAFPVGASRDAGRVDVDWLPNSDARANGEDVAEGSRGLLRCVKLYLYRVANRKTDELGLQKIEFTDSDDARNGDVLKRPVAQDEVKPGQRVAVVVSGFPEASSDLAPQLRPALMNLDPAYDHILAFDYESYGTPVIQNAKTFFQALRAAGINGVHGFHVDIIAHGTGAIVARAMIELENGHRFIDRCFCIGAPNQGSPLFRLKEAASFLGAFMMRSCFRASFVGAFMSYMLRQVVRDGKGLSDLSTNSQFLGRLDENGKRDKIEYHAIAGRYHVTDDQKGYLKKLWNRVCATGESAFTAVFGEENDMVANTSSMLQLSKNPKEPAPTSSVVIDCHHFDYFGNDQALQELSKQL